MKESELMFGLVAGVVLGLLVATVFNHLWGVDASEGYRKSLEVTQRYR